jgi:hypothetical protein
MPVNAVPTLAPVAKTRVVADERETEAGADAGAAYGCDDWLRHGEQVTDERRVVIAERLAVEVADLASEDERRSAFAFAMRQSQSASSRTWSGG